MNESTVISESPDWTEAFAARFAAQCASGTVVALYGDLGAGKSVFARGMANGLGVVGPVTSPTFALVQHYRRPDGSWFVHADMYRLHDLSEIASTGIEEDLFAPHAIVAIEWAERIEELLVGRAGAGLVAVRLSHETMDTRRIVVSDEPV